MPALKIHPFAFVLLVLALALATTASLSAADAPRPRAAAYTDREIKAAALYQLLHFVKWPPERFPPANEPLVIGVYGDPFGGTLDGVIAGQTVQGHALRIRRCSSPQHAADCHVVFIPASERGVERRILDLIQGLPILTVGESERFHASGGIIRMGIEDRRIRFSVDPHAAEQAKLNLSAKLLQLAKAGSTET